MTETVTLWLPADQNPEEQTADTLIGLAAEQLDCQFADIEAIQLDKFSLDARRTPMQWRVALSVYFAGDEIPSDDFSLGNLSKASADAKHAIIIGSGPAGLFAALELINSGWRVTVLERGKQVQERRKDIAQLNRGEDADPESNYAFGEGGAGTYSDGKLYTRSSKRGNIDRVLNTLIGYGAPETISSSWRPHIGSNILPVIISKISAAIVESGNSILFETKAVEILNEGGKCIGVKTSDGTSISSDAVIMASGHSALDSLTMARDAGAQLSAKGFAMGVRVEHPQAWLDENQYKGQREQAELPPSFYSIATQVNERGVFSFCMCPGGWIVPSQSTPGTLVMNGMSLSKRDSPYANSGIVVSIEPKDWCGKRGWRWGWHELLQRAAELSDHPMLHEVIEDPRGGKPFDVAAGRLPIHPDIDPLFGVRLQLALETVAFHAGGKDGKAPTQRCDLFVENAGHQDEEIPTSYLPGVKPTNLHEIMPRGLAIRLVEALQFF
ncbi:MAG: NAD(P)/FAD-dependent oxidoreductase, partial [Planctomycetota bacterium]|nr:NAD(P)/FAD-dependent oxidoreductase [Planctomycetota bacterium]